MAKEKLSDILSPRENPNLFGHELAEDQLLREMGQGKLHHAYLISGPKGIGKATLAYRFARHILAHGAVKAKKVKVESFSLFGDPEPATPTLEPYENEALFRRIAAGSHTDLLTIEPAYDAKKQTEKNTISVEDARKVPEFLSLTPAEGDWRVVIVDAVDQLNTNAANALLKILEEPPAQAILLLICHQPRAILPTIRSRCRAFALGAPERAAFDRALANVSPSIDPADYSALHALSHGSPGFSITLHAHSGIKTYSQWLAAMQPDAAPDMRQRFVDGLVASKSPDAWRCAIHCWNEAISRITLHPHKVGEAIIPGEWDKIVAIADAVPMRLRHQWAEKARELLTVNDIFNLDKRQTIAMLLTPSLLDMAAA